MWLKKRTKKTVFQFPFLSENNMTDDQLWANLLPILLIFAFIIVIFLLYWFLTHWKNDAYSRKMATVCMCNSCFELFSIPQMEGAMLCCDIVHYTLETLLVHIQAAHISLLICNLCGMSLPRTLIPRRKKKFFFCTLCPFVTKLKYNLNSHLKRFHTWMFQLKMAAVLLEQNQK